MTEAAKSGCDWIAVDWGTTHLRVWVMGADGKVLTRLGSDDGMGGLQPGGFEPALLSLIAPYLTPSRVTPVICCGMAGARQGWHEAPYVTAPCAPPGLAHSVVAETGDPRIRVHILPGVMQPEPADVLRGEETQIAGFLRLNPGFDGVACLPGTHTKWVRISAGEIVSFATFMTGELFSLLSRQSVLRHSVAAKGWDDAAYLAALGDAMTRPQAFAARLFTLRAEALLHDLAPATARARLSGLLIGIELAAARPYWLGQKIALIGAEALSRIYARGLAAQGVMATSAGAETMTLAGLSTAHETLPEVTR